MAESSIERFNVQRQIEKAKETGDIKRLEAAQIAADQLPAPASGRNPIAQDENYQEIKNERLKENRLNEQAALIISLEEILNNIVVPIGKDSSEAITPKDRLFKNFVPIRSTVTGHSYYTKGISKTPEMNTFFKKIPPQVLSFLLPSVKVYKTFFAVPQVSTSEKKKIIGYDWKIPFDDIPVMYRGETSEFAVDDIEKLLAGNGGMHSVGIKSFSYEYRGVNPAETNTNIHATMQIFFQNPAELIKTISFGFNDGRFVTNPPPTNSNEAPYQSELKFSYSDLVNQTSRKLLNSDQINDQYYRLKVECGYATPPIKIFNEILESAGFDEKEKEDIKKAIDSSKVTLFLTPYQYDVDFREDGAVILKIDFTAALDSVMAGPDADIFILTEQSRNLRELTEKFEDYILALQKQKKIDEKNEKEKQCVSSEETKLILEEFKAKYPEIASKTTDEILELLEQQAAAAYNSLFSFLVGKETIHADSTANFAINPKIYIAKFKPDILGINENTDDSEKRLEAFKNGNQLISVESIFDEQEPQFIYGDGTTNTEKAASSLNKESEANNGQTSYNIKFILLGDLLDLVFDSINYINPPEDAPRIFVGGIPISIPKNFINDLGRFSLVKDMVEINPNLADIPISLNLFKEFLIKNIVQDKKTRYPAIQFLNDILSQLIYPAISPKVFGHEGIKAAIRFSNFYLTAPAVDNIDPLTKISTDKRNYIRFNEDMLSNSAKITSNLSDPPQVSGGANTNTKKKNFINYMFIVCTSKFPKNLEGNEDDDIQNKGVLHFRMGTDSGIIKKINFQKIAIQYQREMIARREGKGQGTSLKQYYNANVEMFGNNIFRPGDFIYIHPNYMYIAKDGGSQSIDLESKLGFGGYYLVTKVETSMNDMQYMTRLECRFQASIEKDNSGIKPKSIVKPINDDRCL